MKIRLDSTITWGFPYSVGIPDKKDQTERVIEISEDKGKEWLGMQKKYDDWQKEIDLYLQETGFFKEKNEK